MAKQTKEQLEARVNSLTAENQRLYETITGDSHVLGRFNHNGFAYKVSLVNPARAHGGIIVIEALTAGQRNLSTGWLDDERAYFQRNFTSDEYGYHMRELIGKALILRDKAMAA
jgi:hypothetical protein